MSCEDQAFGPIPKNCSVWINTESRRCSGEIYPDKSGFYLCKNCGISWGPVEKADEKKVQKPMLSPEEVCRKLALLHEEDEKRDKRRREVVDFLRSQCKHKWEYEPDPSGNNDSGYSCRCGAWVKHLPK